MKRGELKRLMFLKSAEVGRQITFEEIAEATKLHVNTVRKYLNDQATRPSLDTVQKLANYFDVPLARLLEEEESEERNKNGATGTFQATPYVVSAASAI